MANTFVTRLKGLLGKKHFGNNQSLWIKDCPSVHTFFMQFPIDVVFHDKDMKVTLIIENLKPWRMTKIFQFKNDSCFEFNAQKISKKISKGDFLDVRP